MPFTREMPPIEQLRANPNLLIDALSEAGAYAAGVAAVPRSERSAAHLEDFRSARDFITEWDTVLTGLQRGQLLIPPSAGGGPIAALAPVNEGFRTAGDLLTQQADYQRFAGQRQSSTTHFEYELRGSLFAHNDSFRATVDSTAPGGGVFLPQAPNPIGPRVRQMRMFLRDLIAVQSTGLTSIPYIREVNPAASEYGASAVAENTAKPEIALNWELDEAAVRKIAAWVPVTTEIIDDAATLRGYIDGRLAYLLAVREEFEILSGSGTSPHLKGILQYAALQLQAAVSSDAPATVGRAIGLIENVDGDADGMAMHPLDYWTIMTTRYSTQFDGAALATGIPYGSPPNAFWGLPVIRSRAIARGTALVGSWALGATLFDRQQTVIRVGNQHSDYFTNNKVAVLAEERVALAVHRPDFFVKVTLP